MATRCPRCGGFLRAGENRRNCKQIASIGVTTNAAERCMPPETAAEQLYTGIVPQIVYTTCCDSICGCCEYDASRRNPYWPSFSHPRWLSCRELYCMCPR